ncbi:TorF family putative porin [Leptothrix ochracea]|uniref:TorF family putative porin n=1 Tax=Leptothrix ochracea TaxID=735331 RepID=UPI0034E29C92
MKKIVSFAALSAVAAAVLAPMTAMADDGLSYNVGVVSDYRYRGISQTLLQPAVQGGLDYAKGAFYVGTWASTISWIKDNGVDGNVELDIYAGYKRDVGPVGLDFGLLQYAYVGNKLADVGTGSTYKNANTTEIYGAATFGPATAKLSYALTDLFGNYDFANSKSSAGSYYFDLSATFDVAGFSVVPHYGYQSVANITNASYSDYSVTVSKEALAKGLTFSLALIGTDANKTFYVPGAAANSTKLLGDSGAVLGAKYSF